LLLIKTRPPLPELLFSYFLGGSPRKTILSGSDVGAGRPGGLIDFFYTHTRIYSISLNKTKE
jgi:hypothetical protein